MATSGQPHDKTPSKAPVVLLLGDIADTTWRMFVPTIGLALAGLWADKQFGTKPWLLVTGIICGTLVSALLVKKQLEKINHKEQR